jgi:glycosyltransferase involved in cell wall biosynthesis
LKIIAVVPIFNENKTLKNILKRIYTRVDILVCVNDGSTDDSLETMRQFAAKNKNVFIVNLSTNTGMAGALKQGFLLVLLLKEYRNVQDEDIVVTIDADGQHKPEYIPEIIRYLTLKKADVVLTQRNFSLYPAYKIIGNRFLTWTNSLLSGMKYLDVESGLRFLKVKTLKPVLEYYTGAKYSCAQEIALISARSGFRIDNDFKVDIAYYRPGTTVWDGFIVLFMSFLAFGRWLFHLKSDVNFARPHLRDSYVETRKIRPSSAKRRR